ncbi:NAD-dependent epimerase/dehydratase [Dunaliella salina]|uniref:NAD-dependent epimerase/dehydratase n=1 Tax=Dunaliella salina TaxID=3046 RepID=A0ABQ7GDX9_DUNSA|nr:NAD-dependent epimerase/dehydratase [Dunaliella salina]|eukprot:KAF5832783.1 NAD-dependent epimerase/dehydratase [Dunaliella salina]
MIILITGCSGFIGSHLCEKILTSHIANNHSLHKQCFVVDVVIHLASSAGVRYSIENPGLYIRNNVNKYVKLIQGCKSFEINSLLYASSSSVYGLNEDYPFSEDAILNNLNSPYAITKKCMEDFSSMYSRLYNMQIIGMRFFTEYGPRGRPDMAPYKFLKAIRDTIQLYGDPEHTIRDFTYIDDIIDEISKLLERRNKLPQCDVFNFGSGNPIQLNRFLNICEENVGKQAKT